jgi:hypothetical protein
MAKKFGGFTPQQQQTLLSKVGYTGPAQQDDINKFMMSSPKAASMMGKYAEMAKARVQGGPRMAMQVGGMAAANQPNTTGGFGKGAGGGYATADMQPIYDDAGNVIGYGSSVYQPSGPALPVEPPSEGIDDGISPIIRPIDDGPIEQPSLYSGDITNQTLQDIMKMTTGDTPVDLQYDYNRDGKITSDDALQAGKVGAARGTVSEGTDAGGLYDPSQGLPTAPELKEVNALDFFKANTGGGYYLPEYNETKLANLVNEGSNLSGATAEGNIVTFADGKTITTKSPEEAAQVATAAGAYTTEVVQPNKAAQDTYNKQLDQYKSYYGDQATVTLEDTRANLDTAQSNLAKEQNILTTLKKQQQALPEDDPQREVLQSLIDEQEDKESNARIDVAQAQTNLERVGMPSTTEMRADILDDPMSMVTTADVAKVTDAQRSAGKMAAGTGQAGTAATAGTVTAAKAGDVVAPEVKAAATFTAEKTTEQVQETLDKLTAVTGKPSTEALVEAQTMDPSQLAQLGLTVEQIEQAVTVQAPDARTIQEGELVTGPAVDFERAKAETNFTAATGVPSTEATVQGQLTGLLEQFEGGETPAWAAGAMRTATATLAARGLGASSMAGQAIVQAAMESALPIAQMDAQTRASFEAQNLSNRQQAAMFAAEQRSKFLGMEFDQEFQTRVQNAARIADVANINFNAEQQIALEDARMAQTVDITNLDAKNAKVMADAAAMTQIDTTNLNNRQQSAVQNAQAFLQMDLTNLSNQQQVALFKAQGNIQSIITDAAAANAAAQFNAASENQTNQFYDNLTTQVAQFNNEQSNAMERFNADQANAIAKFNAEQKNARDQFNANNALVVAQANTQWEQSITTMENAAQNAANRDAAVVANNLTETTYNNMLQQERDALDYAVRIADREDQQEHALTIQGISSDAAASAAKGSAVGTVIATVSSLLLKDLI